jgi:hypothetical protein
MVGDADVQIASAPEADGRDDNSPLLLEFGLDPLVHLVEPGGT